MNKKTKLEKGITLIALIVTIIILLILAGITISAITSSGLFGKAKKAEIETYHSIVKEQIILGTNEYQIEKAGGYSGTVIEYLESESYIATVDSESYYRVQVEEAAKNVKTGKGATKVAGDIYVIEDNTLDASTKEYVLRYYDKTGQYIDLLYLGADGTTTDPNPNLGDGGNEDIVTEPEIPDYPTIKEINYIEDLVDVAMDVNNGTNDYTEQTIELKRDLDFTNKEHYRDPDHYYSYNNNQTDYYSLDSLAKVTTSGGTDESAADTTNDSISLSASVYQELNYNSSYSSAPGFTQIGDSPENTFKGVFNGNGYIINNLYISSYKSFISSSSYQARTLVGMFGYNDGYIYNLKLNNAKLSKPEKIDAGVLTGENRNIIKDCTVNTLSVVWNQPKSLGTISYLNTGTIYNTNVTGTYTAVAGVTVSYACITTTNEGEIKNCVLGDKETEFSIADVCVSGGAVVNNMGTIANVTNYYNFTLMNGNFAVIAGNNYGIIDSCNNYGDISLSKKISEPVQAIAGIALIQAPPDNCEVTEINITNCNNYGDINECSYYAGGILHITNGNTVKKIKFNNCNNYGSIVTRYLTCGIFNTQSAIEISQIDITNCTNSGDICSSYGQSAAGIIMINGFNDSSTKLNIISCSNTGNITGDRWSSGIYSDCRNTNTRISNINILKCSNSGIVESEFNYNGGIATCAVADYVKISECINTGNVSKTNASPGGTAGIVSLASRR